MWCGAGLENETLKGLVDNVVEFHLERDRHYSDINDLALFTPCGEAVLSGEAVGQFNMEVYNRVNSVLTERRLDAIRGY